MMRGEQIRTLDELMWAVASRKAVICRAHCFSHRPNPAAFIVSMHARDVFFLIKGGMWIWEKDQKPKRRVKLKAMPF